MPAKIYGSPNWQPNPPQQGPDTRYNPSSLSSLQKYRPLRLSANNARNFNGNNNTYDADRKTANTQIVTNRENSMGGLRQNVELTVLNPQSLNGVTQIPMVVLSRGRAQWIQQTIAAYNPGQSELWDTPIYTPVRLAATRPVFVLVHQLELVNYRNVLGQIPTPQGHQPIVVVGWHVNPLVQDVGGFGASRFAAIALCKHLWNNRLANSNWSGAWLVDDNVVGLGVAAGPNQSPTEGALQAVEAQLGNNVCVGLHAFAAERTLQQRTNHAQKRVALNNTNAEVILQQAVLWNVNDLVQRNLNFCPYFIASAEDVSFSRYLTNSNIPVRFYGNRIIKMGRAGGPDNAQGTQNLNKKVTNLEDATAGAEDNTELWMNNQQQPQNPQDTLARLSDGSPQGQVFGPAFPYAVKGLRAQCQAVEQFLARHLQLQTFGNQQETAAQWANRLSTIFDGNWPGAHAMFTDKANANVQAG
ncbi:MAG: hypothetical protein H6739_28030 [Alphaproteobacteria bacterium]|nr:hypothetical protein [Alphaproteobacteria bacterium]